MTLINKQLKLDKDYSFINFNPFNSVEGELVVDINNEVSVTFDFTASYEAEGYEDYDGEHTVEFGGISDIELEVQTAWSLDKDGDTVDEVEYELDSSLLIDLKKLVESMYETAEPDLAKLEAEYKEMMEGF